MKCPKCSSEGAVLLLNDIACDVCDQRISGSKDECTALEEHRAPSPSYSDRVSAALGLPQGLLFGFASGPSPDEKARVFATLYGLSPDQMKEYDSHVERSSDADSAKANAVPQYSPPDKRVGWIARHLCQDDGDISMIFAVDEFHARHEACSEWDLGWCNGDLSITREPRIDVYGSDWKVPAAIRREVGFGSCLCEACGLGRVWDPLKGKYVGELCPNCSYCSDCGHVQDCTVRVSTNITGSIVHEMRQQDRPVLRPDGDINKTWTSSGSGVLNISGTETGRLQAKAPNMYHGPSGRTSSDDRPFRDTDFASLETKLATSFVEAINSSDLLKNGIKDYVAMLTPPANPGSMRSLLEDLKAAVKHAEVIGVDLADHKDATAIAVGRQQDGGYVIERYFIDELLVDRLSEGANVVEQTHDHVTLEIRTLDEVRRRMDELVVKKNKG